MPYRDPEKRVAYHRAYDRANYTAHREEILARNRVKDAAYRAANREQINARKCACRHHTTADRIDALLAYQGGLCAAGCGRPATEIDHDHDCCPGRYSCGKCIRGLLCHPCNRADALAAI